MLAQVRPLERRMTPRLACQKPAIIQITNAERIICTVTNISVSGALIELKRPMILPAAFELLIAEDLFQAECSLRHQNGARAGVMFTSRLAEAFARYRSPPLHR